MNDRFKFRAYDETYKRFLYRTLIEPKEASLNWEQCTGLKDNNGNLIYEGDILKDHNGIWQVLWDEKEAAFYLYNKKRDFYLSPFIGEFEVIGNIHEKESKWNR